MPSASVCHQRISVNYVSILQVLHRLYVTNLKPNNPFQDLISCRRRWLQLLLVCAYDTIVPYCWWQAGLTRNVS